LETVSNDTQEERVLRFKKILEKDLKGFRIPHFILSPTIYVLLRIYHKYVRITGLEQIEWNKPHILVPSHQNAFMDAFLIISALRYVPEQYIYPLIRADVYENNILRSIVTDFHMIPVFRPRDRSDIASSNAAVFELCEDLLAQNHNLLIHAEGNCIPHKTVRAFKKGFARIAFGAEEKHNFGLNLHILPININYQSILTWGAPVEVTFNDPIPVKSYEQLYTKEPLKATTQLTNDVREVVEAGNVTIKDLNDISLLEDCISNVDQNLSATERFSKHIEIAESINSLSNKEKQKIAEKNGEVAKGLKELGLKRAYFSLEGISILQIASNFVAAMVALPFYMFGLVHHYLPYKLSEWLIDHYVKEKQFKSSARFMTWLFGFPLYYIGIYLAAWLISGQMISGLVYLFVVVGTGIASAKLYHFYKKWYTHCKQYIYEWIQADDLENLRKQINDIQGLNISNK